MSWGPRLRISGACNFNGNNIGGDLKPGETCRGIEEEERLRAARSYSYACCWPARSSSSVAKRVSSLDWYSTSPSREFSDTLSMTTVFKASLYCFAFCWSERADINDALFSRAFHQYASWWTWKMLHREGTSDGPDDRIAAIDEYFKPLHGKFEYLYFSR